MKKLFIILLVFMVAALAQIYVNDAGRRTMPLGDLALSVIDGSATDEDRNNFRLLLNNIQSHDAITSGWIGGNGQPYMSNFYAEQGEFGILPLSYFRATFSGSYSIANDTLSYITFSGTSKVDGVYIKLDPNNLDRVNFAFPQRSRAVFIVGSVAFASNGTGRRSAGYEAFDIDGVSLGGRTLFSMPPTGVATDTYSFADPYLVPVNAAYLKFTALQTSGGALDVEFFRVGIIIVR